MKDSFVHARSRTVLITGASRNIGAHLARRFCENGDRVVVCARRREALESVVAGIRSEGGEIFGLVADVSDHDAVVNLVAEANQRFGTIDVLINNAVVRVQKGILDTTDDEWWIGLRVGLGGAFYCTRAVLPGMIDQGWGRIINFTGIAGQQGVAGKVGICTSKSGLTGFTKSVAREVGHAGITVNAVSPGSIDTDRGPWTAIGDPDEIAAYYDRDVDSTIPLRRMGSLDEIVAPCLFLASDQAGFITGQTVSVNGGRLMTF